MIAIHHHAGSASELHALAMPTEGETVQLWRMAPSAPALVMGSGQKPALFRREKLQADGVELGGRRSGGGAVFIDPAGVAWADLLVPKVSPLWSQDLVETFERVGQLWHQALTACNVDAAVYAAGVADVPSSRNEVARLACWAGNGWGEILRGETKIVGLSQRRTRWGARVQGMAVLNGSATRVVDYLDVDPDVADAVRSSIGSVAPIRVSPDALLDALAAAVQISVQTR